MLAGGVLHGGIFEAGVGEVDPVVPAATEAGHDQVGYFLRGIEAQIVEEGLEVRNHLDVVPFAIVLAEILGSFLTDADDVQGAGQRTQLADTALRRLDDVSVESTGKPPIRCHHYYAGTGDRAYLIEDRAGIALQVGQDVAQHLVQLIRVGTQLRNGLLGPSQLRRRHHFHSAGDLLGVLDRADAFAYFLEVCHGKLLNNRMVE